AALSGVSAVASNNELLSAPTMEAIFMAFLPLRPKCFGRECACARAAAGPPKQGVCDTLCGGRRGVNTTPHVAGGRYTYYGSPAPERPPARDEHRARSNQIPAVHIPVFSRLVAMLRRQPTSAPPSMRACIRAVRLDLVGPTAIRWAARRLRTTPC